MQTQTYGESLIEALQQAIDFENGDTSKGRVRTVEVLNVEPLAEFPKERIKEIRKKNNLTQRTFAEVLGVSPKAVESWETGLRQPTGTARRLFQIIEKSPDVIGDVLIKSQ